MDRRYTHTGVLVVRATTHTGGPLTVKDPDLSGEPDAVVGRGVAWMRQVWHDPEFRRAVEVASPVLSQQVQTALSGHHRDARRVRRLVRSLASYVLRWTTRATPFGLFAGVAAGRIGGRATVRWGTAHRTVVRTDSRWLGEVVRRLEQHRELVNQLPVMANEPVWARGERFVLPTPPPDDSSGGFAPLEVSVRRTQLVRAALAAAETPIRFGELAARLTAQYPAAPPERMTALLSGLLTQGLLLSCLRAPMTAPDALGNLCARLEAADAEKLPECASLVRDLRTVYDELSLHAHSTSPAEAAQIRASAADHMRKISDVAQPLRVDVGLDCEFTFPAQVADEAANAASVLLRLTPHPFGHPHWREYFSRFRQRYGPGALVPIVDLLADSGLGLPAGYLGSAQESGPHTLSERDETLLALVQRVTLDGREEIALDEPLLRTLEVGDQTQVCPPPRVELAFQIHADSLDAVQQGTFSLAVTGTPRPGASMAGRFADVLPVADREALAASYGTAKREDPDVIAAQLSFVPRQRRDENVVRSPRLLGPVIRLSEFHDADEQSIAVSDLAVAADARQLYLVQMSTGRRVEPRVVHALEAGTFTPPLARFLAEVTTARCAVYTGFDWGAAARLPYLPRVRYGRVVLSPARWLLDSSHFPARASPQAEWDRALGEWRRRLHAPAAVLLCESDLRLSLNLNRSLHRTLLRTRLDRVGRVELREAPVPGAFAWCGRTHELLLPLKITTPTAAEQCPNPHLSSRPVMRNAGHLPGCSAWLSARLYCHPDRQDEILTGHLPRLIGGWAEARLWWFRRHRDTAHPDRDPYLELYVRLSSPSQYGAAATRLGDWTAELRAEGLVSYMHLSTYQPETGRYGHGPAMTAAENVFAADSFAALAQIRLSQTGVPADAVTTAGLLDLATAYAATPRDGLRWLTDQLPHETGRLDRSVRETALQLADPHDDFAALRTQPGGDDVISVWHSRRRALTTYRTRLACQRDPDTALRSLLHLHQVRTLGLDSDRERVTHRLVRAAALRQTAVSKTRP